MANQVLTKENESLLKELEDLKLELAQQRSQNLLAQQERSNHVFDVLNTELTCAVCSDVIIEGTVIECGHIFCSFCISAWFAEQGRSQSCPTCRAVFYTDPIHISKMSSAIASLYTIVSEDSPTDLEDYMDPPDTISSIPHNGYNSVHPHSNSESFTLPWWLSDL